MNDTTTQAPGRLVIRRTFAAPRARVYAAFTEPEQMRRWAGPEGFSVPEAHFDARLGGAYRMTMEQPDGERIAVYGVFREVRPPERLCYTWRWEEDAPEDEVETLVTVEFHARGEETELVLTHEQLASEESRAGHEGGWNSAFGKLAAYLAEGSA